MGLGYKELHKLYAIMGLSLFDRIQVGPPDLSTGTRRSGSEFAASGIFITSKCKNLFKIWLIILILLLLMNKV